MDTSFAARLNKLFEAIGPPDRRKPFTSQEMVAALNCRGGLGMSAPYLSQLRTGARTNPSMETMVAIATFFRVDPAYFTDDEYFLSVDEELTALSALRSRRVRVLIELALDLSDEGRQALVDRADELRLRAHRARVGLP